MTNEESILQLIQMNDSLTNAILVERIRLILSGTEEALNENPEIFNTPMTTAAMFRKLVDNANKVWAEDFCPSDEYILFMGSDEFDLYESEEHNEVGSLAKIINQFEENQYCNYEIFKVEKLAPAYKLLEMQGLYYEWVYVQPEHIENLKQQGLI